MSFSETSYSNYRFPELSSSSLASSSSSNSFNEAPLPQSNLEANPNSTSPRGLRLSSRLAAPPPPLSLAIPSTAGSSSRPSQLQQQPVTAEKKGSSTSRKPSLDIKLPRARKRVTPKPPNQERGKRKPVDRKLHNASERVRREALNNKFQELGGLLPSLRKLHKPSKPLIVTSALSFCSEAYRTEASYRAGMESLSTENEILLTMLNQERQKSGLEPITSTIQVEMPRRLSEFELGLASQSDHESQGDEDGDLEELSSGISASSDFNHYVGIMSGQGSGSNFCRQGDAANGGEYNWETSTSQSQLSSSNTAMTELSTPTASHFQPNPHYTFPQHYLTNQQQYQHQHQHHGCASSTTSADLDTPITGGGQFSHAFGPEELNQIAIHRRSTIGIPPQYYHNHHQYHHFNN